MKLHLIDRSHTRDRTQQQFDVLWDDEPDKEEDTVSFVFSFEFPNRALRDVIRPCIYDMHPEQAEIIEEKVTKALKKVMGQAFLSGVSAGMDASEGKHTADLIYKATCNAIATPVCDEAITPIMQFYRGDVTEFIKHLSILLSRLRIEGFIRGWRISGQAQVDTAQWLMAQDFTPPEGKKTKRPKKPNGPIADKRERHP